MYHDVPLNKKLLPHCNLCFLVHHRYYMGPALRLILLGVESCHSTDVLGQFCPDLAKACGLSLVLKLLDLHLRCHSDRMAPPSQSRAPSVEASMC